jgi:glycosyltransferase involved in cell wall biosynthesis
MRVLVALHTLALGGGITAIDLAAGVTERGHDVVVYGVPGPLTDYVHAKGLPFVAARRLRYRPAPSRVAQLTRLAHRYRLDLIHAYEWPPCLDAYFGALMLHRTPLLCTVYSMEIPPYVPASVPLVVGTSKLRDRAEADGYEHAWLLEPPIDITRDHPAYAERDIRRELDIPRDQLLVVCVSRLAHDAKLEPLSEAVDAVDLLAGELPVSLVIIGEGDARDRLASRGDSVNRRRNRTVVMLPGPDPDPRAAYAGADVVIGMGTSTLRGLAFGKPVVVQGERGFAQMFTPASSSMFVRQGMWGLGDGTSGVHRLAEQLALLLRDQRLRAELGAFGRRVAENFALDQAVDRQIALYDHALALPVRRSTREAVHMAGRALGLEWQLHDPRRTRARARPGAMAGTVLTSLAARGTQTRVRTR